MPGSWRIEEQKSPFLFSFFFPPREASFFFAGDSSVTRNWKRGNTKNPLRAFIFLVYRPRGALDNVRMEMTSIRQTSGWRVGCADARDMCAEARVQMKPPLLNGRHKSSPCVRWGRKKGKKRKKKGKRGEGPATGLIGGNSSHWIGMRATWKKIPTKLLPCAVCFGEWTTRLSRETSKKGTRMADIEDGCEIRKGKVYVVVSK